tara:strand:+ start:422 stop:742 length:321 start_codon:yes stop_codon:yes gene_type:complete
MTNKTERTIQINNIGLITDFISRVFQETGETVQDISYKEKDTEYFQKNNSFAAKKGHQMLTLFESMIYSYTTQKEIEIEGDKVYVTRYYRKDDEGKLNPWRKLYSN